MCTADNNTLKSGRQQGIIFALLLLIAVPAQSAETEDNECSVIKGNAYTITKTGNNTPAVQDEGEKGLNDIVKKSSSVQARACWSVMFFQSRKANKIADLTKWQKERIAEFKIDQSPTFLWDLCYQSKCVKNSQWYLGRLKDTCKSMAGGSCDQVEKDLENANRPPQPLLPKKLTPAEKVGKGFLVGAVVLGSASMILGAMHMITPVFQESVAGATCEANGLRLPCVADRFPTGGGLLSGGAVLVIVGAVTWGLKF